MIDFNYISDFQLVKKELYSNWLINITASERKIIGDISFIFCDDQYLLHINQEYLNHDTYTDIITFDYTNGNTIAGDIFISIDRVKDNAEQFGANFDEELRRVMSHGILHLCGYGDKKDDEVKIMRVKEEEKMKLFHVEQTQDRT